MTTVPSTPTSDGLGGVPAGLPDVTLLVQLAGEFFAALPSGSHDARLPFGAPPQPPQTELALANRAPALAPAPATPAAAPDEAVDAATGTGRAANPVYGVPEAYAAALPRVESPEPPRGPSAPSSPYYFLGEASAYPSAASTASTASTTPSGLPSHQDASVAVPEDRVTARSFGLPGDTELRALLAGLDGGKREHAPAAPGAPAFYFLAPSQEEPAPAAHQGARPAFDVQAVRRDFPILQERVNGRPLIWFDNAATTHKPQAVIDRLAYFYQHENSNIHRAAHELAARATDAYEGARNKVARFLGAAQTEEIIFVRGTTEGINLIAKTWGAQNVGEGDEIIVSHLEHHANIVPWQQLAAAKGGEDQGDPGGRQRPGAAG